MEHYLITLLMKVDKVIRLKTDGKHIATKVIRLKIAALTAMKDIENIELRSEEVQEVLGRPPRWILRWGITVIFVVVVVLLVGSYFFKYPEIITAQVVVTTENLPVSIMARTSGRIDTLLVGEKQEVLREQLLAVVENPASFADIVLLTETLKQLPMSLADSALLAADFPSQLRLGEVQNAYSSFLKTVEDHRYFLQTDYHRKKITVIRKQIAGQQTIVGQGAKQLMLYHEQLVIAEKLFRTDSLLFAQGVIAASDYEHARSTLLQGIQNSESAKTGLENQKIGILQLEQSVFDLEQQRAEQAAQLRVQLMSAANLLQAQLSAWEQTYLFRSPVSGIATFTKYWQRNQNITAGEVILTVVPADSAHIVGKIYFSPQGAGKVAVGQTVNIKFDNFPHMEYGMVKVVVRSIALVPIVQNGERLYVLEVDFPQRLTTTYGKTLDFSQEMQGTAEIITEDLRLIERFLNPIRALVRK
jgi:HlyD family secretion protein